jgi:hypothetical protein
MQIEYRQYSSALLGIVFHDNLANRLSINCLSCDSEHQKHVTCYRSEKNPLSVSDQGQLRIASLHEIKEGRHL